MEILVPTSENQFMQGLVSLKNFVLGSAHHSDLNIPVLQ